MEHQTEDDGERIRAQWRKDSAEHWARLFDEKRQVDARRGSEMPFTYYAQTAIYEALMAADKAQRLARRCVEDEGIQAAHKQALRNTLARSPEVASMLSDIFKAHELRWHSNLDRQ